MKNMRASAPPIISDKINRLCHLLLTDKSIYESLASSVRHRALRDTILSLAQSSRQYACELSALIKSMGWRAIDINDDLPEEIPAAGEPEGDHEVLIFCQTTERNMVAAYRDILNESFPFEDLRKLIRQQLNGLLHSFTQLRLLNSLRLR